MKQFLIRFSFFSGLFLLSCLYIYSLADGTTDAFYIKFTTPKQASLIVGSSRAAQGLIPDIIGEELEIATPYNYAFSIAHTAFGSSYYTSIKRKLDLESNDNIYIVCVNPWTISSMTEHPEDSLNFREQGTFIANTRYVNTKPNVEYLVESFQERNINILLNKSRVGQYQTFKVDANGWLEVIIESDMISTAQRTKNKIAAYSKKLELYHGVSEMRLHYLAKTIDLLQQHGRVYLVRLPTSEAMFGLEEQLDVDFNERMQALAKLHTIDYINAMLLRDSYSYTDGHHLDIQSAKQFSKYLAKTIKHLQQNPTKF